MGLRPATGLNTINNIFGLFRLNFLKIPADFPIISIMTKKFLLRELSMYFTNIRNNDVTLSFDEVN
jgi:hypothetical protein